MIMIIIRADYVSEHRRLVAKTEVERVLKATRINVAKSHIQGRSSVWGNS